MAAVHLAQARGDPERNVVTIKATQSADDDATAAALIASPDGTTLTTNQAPGTVLGAVKATIIATAFGGAMLPVEGQLVVAPPGRCLRRCPTPASARPRWRRG